MAATAADEPYAFEPHVSGSLGDCGALVHFDPSVTVSSAKESASKASPLYINAEYLIDLAKIKSVGDFLDIDGTRLLITEPKLMNEMTTEVNPLTSWKNMKHGFYPCGSCSLSKCSAADPMIVDQVSCMMYIST